MKRTLVRGAVTALSLAASLAANAAGYSVVTFDKPGATSTQPFDINNAGQIVGTFSNDGGQSWGAFVLQGGGYSVLAGPAGAVNPAAVGISDGGEIVGNYLTSSEVDASGNALGVSVGFLYSSGSYTAFQVPGYKDTYLRSISPDGRYLTGYVDSDTVMGQGFVYDRNTGAMTVLGAGGNDAFMIAQGVNSHQIMVGGEDIYSSDHISRTSSGFTYDIATGQRQDFMMGDEITAFRDINGAGVIVGWLRNAGGYNTSFVGTPSSFELLDVPSTDGSFAEGINDAGVIVGNYYDADGNEHGYIAQAVPEPSTWLFMAAGLGLLGLRSRRRQRAAGAGPFNGVSGTPHGQLH